MRILQINATCGFGSTGQNVRDLHQYLTAAGHESYIAAPRSCMPSDPAHFYRIGTGFDQKLHSLHSRITGLQAYGSAHATKNLCRHIDKIGPDVIHLQNIHSHFLNLPLFLKFIAERRGALTMTLHDCWFFTGRCVHYTSRNCNRYKIGCGNCPKDYYGIRSWFFDRSAKMAHDKRDLFGAIEHLGLIAVSDWTLSAAKESFVFHGHPTLRAERIYNWIDSDLFAPRDSAGLRNHLGIKPSEKMILGVSVSWTHAKGLPVILSLAEKLPADQKIVLVGKPPEVHLPPSVIPAGLAELEELQNYYNAADVFVSGSTEETFGKSTAESLACGTPAVCFNTTSGPELIGADSGILVPPGDIAAFRQAVQKILAHSKSAYSSFARAFALEHFNAAVNLAAHIRHYRLLL